MLPKKITFLLLIVVLILSACSVESDLPEAEPTPEEVSMTVNPFFHLCQGVGPMLCMQVKVGADAEWTLFYDKIEGFDFEPGYQYDLLVRKEAVENAPADASSIRWTLIEQVNKSPVEMPKVVLTDSVWTLDSISGAPFSEDSSATLGFVAEDKLAGDAGCNTYSTTYQLQGISFSSGPIATTKMACEQVLMDRENLFLQILSDAAYLQIQNDQLLLITSDRRYLEFSNQS